MPRTLVLGNGTMLATFDERLQMRDVYFPYVGLEDHTAYGHVHRLGVYVVGTGFAWLNDDSWEIEAGYRTETLVGNARLTNRRLGIALTMEDTVHPVHNVLIRRLVTHSTDHKAKEVRFFFHHDFHIYGDNQKDTAFYEPATNTVIHYRENRYFLIGAQTDSPVACAVGHATGTFTSLLHEPQSRTSCGLSAFSIGKSHYRHLEGTWRDAEDGELSGNPIEQGSVDSTIGIHCMVEAEGETEVCLHLCLGKTLEEVATLHRTVLNETPQLLIRQSANFWKSWSNKNHRSFADLPSSVTEMYKRSLMMVRLHCDTHGGIIAAADADIMAFNRDTYTYVWPRDGALVSLALDDAGYGEISRSFFEFCSRAQMADGYLLHKYNPDGSPGSSWHPWFRDGEAQLPIQEDETALVLYAMNRHFETSRDFEFLQRMYEGFIKKAAAFLCAFRETETGLPLASYDPWEEHRGIFSYTVATTIAGLYAASNMAQMLGHDTHAHEYHRTADAMKQALLFHLFDESTGRFLKKIKRKDGKTIERDATVDASLSMIWRLGILPADDPRIVSTMQQMEEHLTVRTPVGGIARYTDDYYQSVERPTAHVPGNPWIITTLWLAEWRLATAKTQKDLEHTKSTLEWATQHASHTGILPEQLHPHTGAPLSVAPLTWSHATFVQTVLRYLEAYQRLASVQGKH